MNKNLRNRLLLIIAVVAASLYFTFPLNKRINLGLDLKGGMHLVLKVDTEKLADNAKSDAVLRAMEILRNRIDGMGVAETLLQRQGEDEIIVQLPGITDRKTALEMIGRVAQLEFKLVSADPNRLKKAVEGNMRQLRQFFERGAKRASLADARNVKNKKKAGATIWWSFLQQMHEANYNRQSKAIKIFFELKFLKYIKINIK